MDAVERVCFTSTDNRWDGSDEIQLVGSVYDRHDSPLHSKQRLRCWGGRTKPTTDATSHFHGRLFRATPTRQRLDQVCQTGLTSRWRHERHARLAWCRATGRRRRKQQFSTTNVLPRAAVPFLSFRMQGATTTVIEECRLRSMYTFNYCQSATW